MTEGTDRRSVLTGLGTLGVMGCSPAREVQAPAVDAALDLSPLEARDGGRIGVCAAQDGNRVSWRGDERFNYCSTFKLFLAAATLERIQRGEERLDREIPVTAGDMVSHAPVTAPAVGSTLTIEQLCKGTVEVSDNPAANILIREFGGLEAWRDWYRSIDDRTTTVDRLEPMMNRKDGDKDTTTPRQAVANLIKVFDADNVLRPAPELAIRLTQWLIDSPTGMNRIKAGVPSGWSVAHKTGTGGTGQTNDIGVLSSMTGRPVHIAIYYDASATLSEARRDAAIAEATRVAMRALGHNVTA